MSDKTEAGAMDDDSVKRAKKNEESKQKQLDAIFNDNKTGRYGKSTDE